jgi:hypothetical protein
MRKSMRLFSIALASAMTSGSSLRHGPGSLGTANNQASRRDRGARARAFCLVRNLEFWGLRPRHQPVCTDPF